MKISEYTSWCLYRHISPSGKAYIGITHHKDPRNRWGSNGCNYAKCTAFKLAIDKYGWNNIEHEILFEDITFELAKLMERSLIAYYKKYRKSYNMTIGGEGYNFGLECTSKEYRTESSKKFRALHPDFDAMQYQKHKEARKANARKYYYEHRERILEQKRSDHYKEQSRIRCAKWRKDNPDYMKQYMKKYNQTHKNNRKKNG